MTGAFLLFSIVAIVWLVFWSLRDQRARPRYWSPFDMREPEQKPEPASGRQRPQRRRG